MPRGSTVSLCVKVIASACVKVITYAPLWKGNCLCMWKGDCLCWSWGLMIDAERINSQLSHGKFKRFNLFLVHVGIKTVYITVYNWHREDQQSLHVKRWLHFCAWKGDHLCTWKGIAWSWGVKERINSQLSHGKFKRFNLFFLHVGIKTVYITV